MGAEKDSLLPHVYWGSVNPHHQMTYRFAKVLMKLSPLQKLCCFWQSSVLVHKYIYIHIWLMCQVRKLMTCVVWWFSRATPYSKVMFPLNATAAPNLVFLRIPCIHLVPHVCQLWPLQNTVQKYCWAILLRILLRKTVAKYSWGIQVVASVCKLQPLHLPRPPLTYSRAGPD